MKKNMVFSAILLVFLLGCSGSDKEPASNDYKSQFSITLPAYFSLSSFDIEASENLGTKVEPVFKARFKATISLKTDTYEMDRQNNDATFIKNIFHEGEKKDIYGIATAKLFAGSWKIEFTLENNPIRQMGRPKDFFTDNKVIIVGSQEETDYLSELEKNRSSYIPKQDKLNQSHASHPSPPTEERDHLSELEKIPSSHLQKQDNVNQPQASHSSPPTAGLVAYYPFNRNAMDESGNGNNGTVYGATLTTDRFGNAEEAYGFNGWNAYIVTTANNILSTCNKGTLSLWFKTPAIVSDRDIFAYSTDASNTSLFTLQLYEGKIWFAIKHNTGKQPQFRGTTILQPNQWYHLILVADGVNAIDAYLNNEHENLTYIDDGSGTNGNFWFSSIDNISSSNHFISIGALRRGGAAEGFYSGSIDDIRIYNRALSPSEIQALYHERD
jgi:Concanavalin A-like lectin/glucanases superfamily